jgi:hypothetical protein
VSVGRLRSRLTRASETGHHVCRRCGGTGVEPVGLPSDEDRHKRTAQQALDEARRKVEREREVRAALGPAVVDVRPADERPESRDGAPPLRLVPHDSE